MIHWQFKVMEKGTRNELLRKDLAQDLTMAKAQEEARAFFEAKCCTRQHTLRLYSLQSTPKYCNRWTKQLEL